MSRRTPRAGSRRCAVPLRAVPCPPARLPCRPAAPRWGRARSRLERPSPAAPLTRPVMALLKLSPGRVAKCEALPELRRAMVTAFLMKHPLAPHAGGPSVSFSASRSRENRESFIVFLHPLGVFYGIGGVQTCSGSMPPIPRACLCKLCPAAVLPCRPRDRGQGGGPASAARGLAGPLRERRRK